MCAKKVRQDRIVHRRPMFNPYPIEVVTVVKEAGNEPARGTADGSPSNPEMDAETALRIRRDQMTWKDWALYDFLRYWYWLVALSVVAFLLVQLSWTYHIRDTAGLSGLALGGFLLIVLAFYMYKVVWPQGAFTEGWPAGRRLRKAILRLRWRL